MLLNLLCVLILFLGGGQWQKIVLQLYSSQNSLQHITQAACWQGMLIISMITKSNSNTIMGNVWAKSERPQTTEVQCMVKMHAHFSLAPDTKWSSDVKAPRLVNDQTAIQPLKMSAVLRHSSQSTRLSITHSGSSQITMSRKYVKTEIQFFWASPGHEPEPLAHDPPSYPPSCTTHWTDSTLHFQAPRLHVAESCDQAGKGVKPASQAV